MRTSQTTTTPGGAGHAPESAEVQINPRSPQISLTARIRVRLKTADQFREQFKTRPGSGQCSEAGALLGGRTSEIQPSRKLASTGRASYQGPQSH